MANIILEQNGVNNTNIDGARFNYFSAGQQNGVIDGALNECFISKASNNVIVNTGEILISGFRIILEQTTFNFNSLPVSVINYAIVAEITVASDETVNFRLFLQNQSTPLVTNNIFVNGYGRYQIELGRITVSPSGILNCSRTAPLIKGGVGQGVKGSVWYQGTVVTGTGESIYVLVTDIPDQVNVNDFYLNSTTGNCYQCMAKSTTYYYFDYVCNLKGTTGDGLFIRYSAYSDGTDFTTTWTSDQGYMGIAIGQSAPLIKGGYTWVRFNGVECTIDDTTTNIEYTIAANKAKTFTSNSVKAVNITIPSTVYMGYISEVTFKTGTTPPTVSFDNNSPYSLLIMQFGSSQGVYHPAANKVVSLLLYCDGINVYCYVNEV